jgi:hypothetical protein
MVSFTLVSKTKFPFQETMFTRNITTASGENKTMHVFLALVECHSVTPNL